MASSESPPSIFETFNARALSAEELAKGFIPSPQFGRVIRPSHTLVIGPRGSGKTSLLKMLQPRALAGWKGEEADEYRPLINDVGIYIPTGISWAEQLQHLGVSRSSLEERRQIERPPVTVHVLHS